MIDLPEKVIVSPPYIGPPDVPVGMFLVEQNCDGPFMNLPGSVLVWVHIPEQEYPRCPDCGQKTWLIANKEFAEDLQRRYNRQYTGREKAWFVCPNQGRFIE